MEPLIPQINKIRNDERKKIPYDLWIEDNKEDIILIYKLIKNYDKNMNFLNIVTSPYKNNDSNARVTALRRGYIQQAGEQQFSSSTN